MPLSDVCLAVCVCVPGVVATTAATMRSAAIASGGKTGWLLWSFDKLPPVVQDNLGAGVIATARHSCAIYTPGGQAALAGQDSVTGLPTVTKMPFTHLPPRRQ